MDLKKIINKIQSIHPEFSYEEIEELCLEYLVQFSDKTKELKKLLKTIKDTEDYYWGVYCLVKNQPLLDEMIEFLKKVIEKMCFIELYL